MSFFRRKAIRIVASLTTKRLTDYLRDLTLSWLVPVAVLAITLVFYFVYQIHRQQAQDVVMHAQRLAAEIDLDIQRRQHGLKSIAAITTSGKKGSDLIEWYENARSYDLVFGTPVILADESRRILFNTRAPFGQPLADLPRPPGPSAFKSALDSGQPRVSDVVFGPVIGRKIVTIIMPINGNRALLGLVPLPEIDSLLRRQLLPGGWGASIFDSAGNIIASTKNHEYVFKYNSSSRRVFGLSEYTPWSIVIEVDLLDFYKPHIEAALSLFLCVSLAFIGGTLSARRGGKSLASSVKQLVPQPTLPETGQQAAKPLLAPPIAEFEATRIELRKLSKSQLDFEESERARLARDLQSGLQHDASEAAMHIEVLRSQLEPKSSLKKPALAASECIRRVIVGIANAVQDLQPASVAAEGLHAVLSNAARRFRASTGVNVQVQILGDESILDELPDSIVDCLYRVVQERLSYVRKHAPPNFVDVELDVTTPGRIRMRIMDDGAGMAEVRSEVTGGLGWRAMLDRISAVNGTLEVAGGHEHTQNGGTTVIVVVPIPQE